MGHDFWTPSLKIIFFEDKRDILYLIRDGESEHHWEALIALVREGEKFSHGIQSVWTIEGHKITFQGKKAGF
jgi:hypothetical protein